MFLHSVCPAFYCSNRIVELHVFSVHLEWFSFTVHCDGGVHGVHNAHCVHGVHNNAHCVHGVQAESPPSLSPPWHPCHHLVTVSNPQNPSLMMRLMMRLMMIIL